MKVVNLYNLSNRIIEELGGFSECEVKVLLNDDKHESIQQEVHRMSNGTLKEYKSKPSFDVYIDKVKFKFIKN